MVAAEDKLPKRQFSNMVKQVYMNLARKLSSINNAKAVKTEKEKVKMARVKAISPLALNSETKEVAAMEMDADIPTTPK